MSYQDKVLGIEYANLIGYWPLDETAGGTADDKSAEGNDGSYVGVDLANAAGPDGPAVPYFDGTNDLINLESSGLSADIDGNHFTFSAWCKVQSSSVWTDGYDRTVFRFRNQNNPGVNAIFYKKATSSNTIETLTYLNGTYKYGSATISTTNWFHLASTIDSTADEIKFYINGSQQGSTLTSIGTWSGVDPVIDAAIGSYAVPVQDSWHGWLAHVAIWTKALTPAQIGDLATIISPTIADNITLGESIDLDVISAAVDLSIDIGLDEAAYQGTGVRII